MEAQTEPSSQDKNTHPFQAEVSRVLSLVINSLYSNKEIFLRELLSNASDALDKLRFRTITEPDLVGAEETLKVQIIPDREARTLTVWDNGIGMTADELTQELGTIAHSGTQELLQKLEQAKGDLSLIGQFGVGFYSGYLVADYVEVVSRAAGERQAHRWASTGQDTFTVEPAERNARGTSVTLHLREGFDEYLEEARLREIVQRYSDYLGYPIELSVDREGEQTFETINSGKALWQQPTSEIAKEQYEEFYKHLTHDWEPPVTWKHFKVEGTQEFVGLVFIPSRVPFDLYMPDSPHGVRLHVKRVFVMEDCKELLPRWLRFVRGVVDSEDLPLNVSRELLQDSQVVQLIRKQVTKQALDLLHHIAQEQPADYANLWRNFGAVIKEGLHFEPQHKDRLVELLRYESSKSEGELVSLAQYKERMPEGQQALYYALGQSREHIESSPHLEILRKRGYEVLYMTDPVDQWAVSTLSEYDGVPLVSSTDPDLKLGDDEEGAAEEKKKEQRQEELSSLLDRFRQRLQDWVSEVRLSNRLTDSPVCLVVPEGGLQPWIERMVRASTNQEMPRTKRILEVNPEHQVVRNLQSLLEDGQTSGKVDEWIDLLFDQALLAEGSPVEDPGAFARRLSRLLQEASDVEVQRSK